MDDAEWSGPATRPYTQRKKKGVDKGQPLQEQEKNTFFGEESFMNAIHPFEANSKRVTKKSSPMQRAIINCIIENGGKAKEKDILKYVTEKWDIINKYSERGFLVEPNIRVIRLNCAVKKKGRHLFVQAPDDPEMWMLNSIARRSRKAKATADNKVEETIKEVENENEKIDEIEDDADTEERLFEDCIFDFLRSQASFVNFDEICKNMEKYRTAAGAFSALPFQRRVKACLIKFKCQRRIFSDSNSENWSFSVIPENRGARKCVLLDSPTSS